MNSHFCEQKLVALDSLQFSPPIATHIKGSPKSEWQDQPKITHEREFSFTHGQIIQTIMAKESKEQSLISFPHEKLEETGPINSQTGQICDIDLSLVHSSSHKLFNLQAQHHTTKDRDTLHTFKCRSNFDLGLENKEILLPSVRRPGSDAVSCTSDVDHFVPEREDLPSLLDYQSEQSVKIGHDQKCCKGDTDKNELSNLHEMIDMIITDNTSLINPKEEQPNEVYQQGKDCLSSTANEMMQENSVALETFTSFNGTTQKFGQNTINTTKCPNVGKTQITQANKEERDNQEHTVPKDSNRLCGDDCLTDVSLYSGLHCHFSEIKVAHEKEEKPVFQWYSAHKFTPDTSVKNSASGDTALSPVRCLMQSRRPLRLGLSRRQKMKHLHNK